MTGTLAENLNLEISFKIDQKHPINLILCVFVEIKMLQEASEAEKSRCSMIIKFFILKTVE